MEAANPDMVEGSASATISQDDGAEVAAWESVTDPRRMESVASNARFQRVLDANTPYEVFDREHRDLRDGIAALRRALLSDHASSSAWLIECIDTVRAQLGVHFAFEQDGGFKHYLWAAHSPLAPEIDRLQREHTEILAVLTKISAGLNNGLSCADVRNTVTSVLEQLANHELDEHQLLLSAFRGGSALPGRIRI